MLETGVDGEGKPIFKNKSFNNVKTAATADQLYATANALLSLQQHALFDIERNDSFTLAP
ncbi:DUF1659 domain-containing protein [Bacillus taeanensis]|uniref:DUF1659 domain-containing protein n=1 Tax=Bacillus taeanensis TaxID=273032 RepID=UPI001FE4446D|nr:DUF1659 domain-containing protein [Bacillus taeanensis]